ncbi:MCE family protein [Nocardioides kribbensis]|uniref:MCE family protein n=1 Tax=Nocardioides kribbensis TaxID=305517 RepID=A0ABV1P0R0_9ACTN
MRRHATRPAERRRPVRRGARALVGLALGSMLLSGCDFDVYQIPLPGGPDVGDNPMEIEVVFSDVLDLVPQSTVKVNDVTVGQVKDIELEDYAATVTLEIQDDTELPADAVATIRQTSLLGEKFVSLAAPTDGGSGRLEDGDEIPIERTGQNPEVEEVLGALSLVLNGGGVAQLKTIAGELNNALEGREDSARSVLTQVDTLVSNLDDNKADIVDAIESLNRLALAVKEEQPTINAALEELPSAITSLDRQRDDLVRMLQSLNRLGDVGVRVIRASKADTIEVVRQLQPVLGQLAASGDNFVKAFNAFLTYPFVDEVVGRDPQVARNLQVGDYTNLSVQLDLDLSLGITGIPTELPTLLPTELDPTAIVDNVLKCLQSGDLTSKACRDVLNTPAALLELRELCRKPKNKDKAVCTLLNQVPGLPELPGLPDLPGLGGSTGGGGLLDGLLRPGALPGDGTASQAFGERGPTMQEMTQMFDPGLVQLLVPAAVVR